MNSHFRFFSVSATALLFATAFTLMESQAASYTSAGSGSWGNGANWSPVAPAGGPDPEFTDDVIVNGGFNILVDGTSQTQNNSSTIVDSSHTITVTGVVSGNRSTLETHDLVMRGGTAVTVSAGGVFNVTGYFHISQEAGLSASTTLTGAGSVMFNAGDYRYADYLLDPTPDSPVVLSPFQRGPNGQYIGNDGTGTLDILSGAKYYAFGRENSHIVVGHRDNVSGTLTIDGTGSELLRNYNYQEAADRDFTLGGNHESGDGGDGVVIVRNGGALTDNTNLIIARNDGSNGTLTIGVAGAGAGQEGTVSILETTELITPAAGTVGNVIVSRTNGVGTLNLYDGLLDMSGGLILARQNGGNATVNFDGSAATGTNVNVRLDYIRRGDGGGERGTATINFNGVTVRANQTETNFMRWMDSTRAVIGTSGLIIDTNGNNITITDAATGNNGFGGAGGLRKIGAGTMTLQGTSTYTGQTRISAGTLTLDRSASDNGTIATDNNTATISDILIDGGTLTIARSEQIANTGSIDMSSGAFNFSGSGRTETIDKFRNSGGTFTTGANTLVGLGNTITWSGGTNTINDGGTVTDQHWDISGGTNTVNGGATGGTLQVSGGGTGLEFTGTGSPTVTLDSNATVAGRILLQDDLFFTGTAGTGQILNGGAAANPGKIDMDGGTRIFNINDGTASTDMLISARIQNGALTKTNTGTLELSGNNTFTGNTTINAGTIRASGTNALGSTGLITVNSGGTLLLAGTGIDRVNNSTTSTVNLNGGVISMQGLSNQSETMGDLTLTADSTIDFGTGNGNTLRFDSLSIVGASRLLVYGWTGTIYSTDETTDHGNATQDRLLFTNNPMLTAPQLAQVLFYNDGGSFIGSAHQVLFGGTEFELVPVPEPSTIIGALGMVALVGYRERRRISSFYAATRARMS